MTGVDLFAGVGGFTEGFERAGIQCVCQVENDGHCIEVLEERWPDVPRRRDVREAGKHNLPVCDVLDGGFPCQDLSVSGKRSGLFGARSRLFFEFVRIAAELRPTWLVIENVPRLLTSDKGRDFAVVLLRLEEAGYRCAWRVLDSQWFGVAQRRRRLFIVGHADPRCAGAVLFEPESGAGHPATVRKTGQDIAYALNASTGGVSGKENQQAIVSFNWHTGGSRDFTGVADKPGALHGRMAPAVAYNTVGANSNSRSRHAIEAETTGALQTGGNRPDGNGPGTIVAPTLLSSDGGASSGYAPLACAEADADRVRESAGLPKGMDTRRYKQTGNAVTVPVVEWIGRRILMVAAEGCWDGVN